MDYLRLSGPLGCLARLAWQLGLATALAGGGLVMVSDAPLQMVGPLEFAAFGFWMLIGMFQVSIEVRLPLETRDEPPALLARKYPTPGRRRSAWLVAYQLYQVTMLVLVIVSVKLWLDQVAGYAVRHGWG